MTAARMMLVCYDIADRRRWRRAHRLAVQHGEMQQLSVYLCRLTPGAARRLRAALEKVLHPTQDRLMVVDLGPAEAGIAACQVNLPRAGIAPPLVI